MWHFQRSLANTEKECKHLKELHEEHQQELLDLTEKYETKVMEHADLSNKLKVSGILRNKAG